jgi:hypothetical protein
VNVVMNIQVPQNAGNPLSGYATGGPLSSAQLKRISWLVSQLGS